MQSDQEKHDAQKAYMRAYYLKNREKIKGQMATWRAEHPEKLAELNKKENRRTTRKKYRAAHPDYCAESQKAWRDAHPEYMKDYARDYRARQKAWSAKQ